MHGQMMSVDYASQGAKSDARMLPCCSPALPMDSLTVLFLVDARVYKRKLSNLVVTACGCG